MRLVHALRARLRLLLDGRGAESRMDEEIALHLELEAERLVREERLAPGEANRRARVAFGGVQQHREALRDGRGLAWLGGLRLDLVLGVRMLARHPGLSIVAVLGMAVAIAIASAGFGFISAMLDPTLPLPAGERIVALQNADSRNPGNPDRRALRDFALWRERLTRVQELGAYTADSRTLVPPDGQITLVSVAYMTASGFRVAAVAPALGRPLLDADERPDAPPVLVLAHEEWQRRFGGDPAIVGRAVRLGRELHTVVGVMPEGFRFPVNHRYWVPLRLDALRYEPGGGPELHVFGRLAPGVSLQEARAEVEAVGPAGIEERGHLRPQLLPYAHPFFDIDSPVMMLAMRGFQLALTLLLVLVAVNVAVLVYARTAARVGEIAVRTALGASRRRVVGQLFAEALVLSLLAAGLGLAMARGGIALFTAYLARVDGPELPFWFDLGLSPGVVLYVVGSAVLAAVIVGVLPALQATGRDVQRGLQQLTSRGSHIRLGRTWTALIVAQVAVAVAVLPFVGYIARQSLERGLAAPRFPIHEVLRAEVSLDRLERAPAADSAAYEAATQALFAQRVEELVRRVEVEAGVAGVTFASAFPGEEQYARIEVEGGEERGVRLGRVDVLLLDVLDVPVILGRGLSRGDLRAAGDAAPLAAGSASSEGSAREEAAAAVIDAPLATWLDASGGVLGRRIRFVRRLRDEGDASGAPRVERGPWLEVVGVAPEFTVQPDFEMPEAKVYLPTSLAALAADARSVSLAVRVRGGSAAAFAGRLRQVAAAVDPALQLHDLRTAADLQWETQQALRLSGIAVLVATLSVLLLSAAGMYAMMAFTVTRRRREIGIRAALGADARRILSGVFARAGAQLGGGVTIGVALATAIHEAAGGELVPGGEWLRLLALAAGLMTAIGLAAAAGPARRGLAVQPTEALREE